MLQHVNRLKYEKLLTRMMRFGYFQIAHHKIQSLKVVWCKAKAYRGQALALRKHMHLRYGNKIILHKSAKIRRNTDSEDALWVFLDSPTIVLAIKSCLVQSESLQRSSGSITQTQAFTLRQQNNATQISVNTKNYWFR